MIKITTKLGCLLAGLFVLFGYMPVEKLNYARNIAKRLDEHRELVEAIASKTTLLSQCEWHIGHLATQDDFLMRLYYQVHTKWPEGDSFVRQRPPILGPSTLPEYPSELNTNLLNREGKKTRTWRRKQNLTMAKPRRGNAKTRNYQSRCQLHHC